MFVGRCSLKSGIYREFFHLCKYPQGFSPENKQRGFSIPQQGQHLGQDLFLWEIILDPGWALFLLSSIDGARGSFSLPQPSCSSCQREDAGDAGGWRGWLEKAEGKEKGFKWSIIQWDMELQLCSWERAGFQQPLGD